MNFQEVYKYGKDADTVFKMFTDRSYFERKYEKTADSHEVLEHAQDDNTFRIKVKRSMPADAPVPGFAKKFLPGNMTVIQEDIWDLKTRTGRLHIEIHGAPVSINADMKLIDGADGAENHLSWEINCNVPLVGGKVAKFVAEDMKHKTPADLAISNEILEDY